MLSPVAILCAILCALPSVALARPTEGGSYAYDAADEVTYIDGATGHARVWYSASGPNMVKEGDEDADGVPDFAEMVAAYTEDVLVTYEEFGFRDLVSDGNAGGSDAMDVYLVDFGGDADGNYAAESCTRGVCSGYFQMENDFKNYGYSDAESAISTLTSHELFHAQQAAYDSRGDSWYAEGTAVWAEEFFDPGSEDFQYFCDYYLTDTGRSLDEPPVGPIPTFSYSTALWWYFVTQRYGDEWMIDYLEATAAGEDLVDALASRVDLNTDFVDFAAWNLATGSLSGGSPEGEGYEFASAIGPPKFEDRGAGFDDEERFYPLSTTYYKLEWEGGPLQFGLAADSPDVVFQVWGTDADERVNGLVAEPASLAGVVELGDLAAGDYYFAAVNPTLAEESTKVQFCLSADASNCEPAADTEDTGDTNGKGGCSCAPDLARGGRSATGAAGLFLLGLARRRRSPRSA
ncbi:MAG: hypothetical protein EXR69_08780 [Myxococcales bacterium]|nr:hypothetical protein [Myxococcales bacterium]